VTVTFTFDGGQRISQAWNATVTQSGNAVTARNVGWNGTLAPGTTATFGFLANWTGTNPPPTATCVAA
jgi:cellulase/cellobiase CelA1